MENNRIIKLQKEKQDPAMEDAISLILHGCSLARELEFNALNFYNNSHFMAISCDDILGVFSAAKERLASYECPPSVQPDAGLEEWLKSTSSQAMVVAQMQPLAPAVEDSGKVVGTGFGFSSSSSSSTKARRRKDDMEKKTVRVAAPRIGNTDLPPDDGFTWRKYGQKEILGSRFPRGYFRCTHQKLYQCAAKKHVQRLDHDPHTFEITYRGEHTCHMSATAPSAPPPLPVQHLTQSTGWLSMEFVASASGSSSPGGGGAPPIRYVKDAADHFPALDMADTMFNSGTGGSNSIDSIFAAYVDHHKWEKDDKNN